MATTQAASQNVQTVDREKIYLWINELTNPETRESALFELRYLCFFGYIACNRLLDQFLVQHVVRVASIIIGYLCFVRSIGS